MWSSILEQKIDRGSQRNIFTTEPNRSSLNSPDVGFETSLNPYRGCEHGCIYCYARPTHEYLGFSAGLDFESKIMVKTNRQSYCARTAITALESTNPGDERRDRSVSADRAKTVHYSRLPRSPRKIS
jgi:hypothetical protein